MLLPRHSKSQITKHKLMGKLRNFADSPRCLLPATKVGFRIFVRWIFSEHPLPFDLRIFGKAD